MTKTENLFVEINGKRMYYVPNIYGDLVLHRIDGPAVEWINADRPPLWYFHGWHCRDFDEWCMLATSDDKSGIDNELAVMLKLMYG